MIPTRLWRRRRPGRVRRSYAAAQSRYTITDEASAGPGTPQVVVLHDNVAGVEAAVTPSEGGELSSYRVKLKGDWTEFLYHARDYSDGPGFKGKGPLLVAGRGRAISGRNGSRNQLRAGSLPGRGKDLHHALPRLRPHPSLERDQAVGGRHWRAGDRGTARIEEPRWRLIPLLSS